MEPSKQPKEKVTPIRLVKPKTVQQADPLSFEYIIDKKPSGKKVLLYLQKMIDDIVEENDL
jgi:hypothetical protein